MKKFIIYTDGGSRGNPGKAGVGFVICNENGEELKKYGEYIGNGLTNNEAEYGALIMALKKFKAQFGAKSAEVAEIEIRSDSEFMVKQLTGQYKVMDEKIQKLFIEVWNLKLDFGEIKFKHIPREKNAVADRMVNEALDNIGRNQNLI